MGSNTRLILLLFVGALAGSVVNEALIGHVPSSLTRSFSIGLNPPVLVDLWVLTFTLGFTLKVSLLSVVGMGLGLYAYRKWLRA